MRKGEWCKFKDRMCATFLFCIALLNYTISTTYIFDMCFSDKKRQELKEKLKERQNWNILPPIIAKYILSKIK